MATIDYGNPSVVSGDMGVGRVRRAVGALRLGPHLLRDIGMD
jgi:hypothetical protein